MTHVVALSHPARTVSDMTAETLPSIGWARHHPLEAGESREVRWLTPKHLVEPLGAFDLDPCGAPGHDLARTTFLPERGEDGLKLPWFGRVWLNPPYGREAEPFLARLCAHGQGTALIFARTETAMFHTYIWQQATAMLFVKGRITFLDAQGVPAKANGGAPSVFVAYGDADAQALAESGIAGHFIRL